MLLNLHKVQQRKENKLLSWVQTFFLSLSYTSRREARMLGTDGSNFLLHPPAQITN